MTWNVFAALTWILLRTEVVVTVRVLGNVLKAETRTHEIKPSVYWSRLFELGLRQTSRGKMGCRDIQRALHESVCMAVRYLVIPGKKRPLHSRKTSCLPEQCLLPWLWTVPSLQPRQCSLPGRTDQDAKFSKSAATPFCVQRLFPISSEGTGVGAGQSWDGTERLQGPVP